MDINKYIPKKRVKFSNLLQLSNCVVEDIYEILYLSKLLKKQQLAKEPQQNLKNKTIALVNTDLSIKTKLSFELGIKQLGGQSVFINDFGSTFDDNIIDSANIVSLYDIDAVVFSGIDQNQLELFAKHCKVPVINNYSTFSNPSQVLADILTVWEKFGSLQNIKLAYVGSATSYANSLLIGSVMCGIKPSFACPAENSLRQAEIDKAMQYGDFTLTNDPILAVKNADIVVTDSWHNADSAILKDYAVTERLFSFAKEGAYFMHPLPAVRGREVESSVIDGTQSLIYQQAENRLSVQKAILALIK